MNILCAVYSRSGNTRSLMEDVTSELETRGHSITWEELQVVEDSSIVRQVFRDIHHYPAIALGLFNRRWRNHYIKTYHQVEEDIVPLTYPDVSQFDRIIIAGPKWAQLSYPIARYINIVQGLEGKRVGFAATFGGPPLPVFEVELVKRPAQRFIEGRGAQVVSELLLSSGRHEVGLMPIFRFISRVRFFKPVSHYTIGSYYAREKVQLFCDDLLREEM
jgi:hypothetical protein